MKKNIIISCMLVLSCAAFSQQIKKANAEFDDLITLLGAAGYELFNYDISEMLNERYNIVVIKKEFSAGKEIKSSNLATAQNKRLLTDLPEDLRKQFIDEGRIIDPKNQAIAHAEKICFGFYPSGNDSTKLMHIEIPEFYAQSKITFKMTGITVKDWDKMFFYTIRPFQIKAFKENEFIPLILISSGWYDERFNIFRSCGEREVEPEMSDALYKNIPHHYIIGVKFVKTEK